MKILLFLSLYGLFGFQDKLVARYNQLLTSNNEQEWVLENTALHLSGNNCSNGMVLSFTLTAKKVIWKDCVDGKWDTKLYSWRIEKVSASQFNLIVASKGTYEIDFIKKLGHDKDIMRLREAGKGKDREDFDMFFIKN